MENIKPTKADVEKQIKNNLFYYTKQAKIIDNAKARASRIALRRNFLKLQKINNYQSEYDRIRTSLNESTLARNGAPSVDHLIKRKEELEKLGLKALDKMPI